MLLTSEVDAEVNCNTSLKKGKNDIHIDLKYLLFFIGMNFVMIFLHCHGFVGRFYLIMLHDQLLLFSEQGLLLKNLGRQELQQRVLAHYVWDNVLQFEKCVGRHSD